MAVIEVKPLFHRNKECIGLYFNADKTLNTIVRKIPLIRWSNTHKCWYAPCTQEHYTVISNAFAGKAVLQTAALKEYLLKKKKSTVTAPTNTIVKPAAVKNVIKTTPQQTKPITFLNKLSSENQAALEKFIQQLHLKAYSPSTIKTYRNELMQLLQLLKNKPVNTLTAEDLKRYMAYILQKEKVTENTAHSRLNALKFYFEQVLEREKFFWEIPRPKKHLILPKVLGEAELTRLFKSLDNKKHKAILFTAYSAGLRVSEVVRLQLKHIDSDRMQLFIEKSKGKKDRLVMLSPVLLDILRNYIKTAQPRPVKYLFEGQEPGQPYTSRSAQRVFQMAKDKAGITKELGFHSLRHSFATHLLEKGTDVKYIKELLGHFDIKTTERYLHVKKDALVNIVSPLDDLWKKEDI
jgi:integrase/recombinase XerD